MDGIIEIMSKIDLFDGYSPGEIECLLEFSPIRRVHYGKGEMVLWEGERLAEVGIVLSGRGRSFKRDANGKTITITLLKEGSYIGLLLAASRGRESPVSVEALEALEVLFLPVSTITSEERLTQNYLSSVTDMALVLHDRIDCLLRHSVRDKITAYLSKLSLEHGELLFDIPLDRAAMADYLNVERSALSRELSRMKSERLLNFSKNTFHLLPGFSEGAGAASRALTPTHNGNVSKF